MSKEISTYNISLSGRDRAICEKLEQEINSILTNAESKIWHGAPVWFIDGNPIVGYDKLKNCVRLLFWSGQSFEESGLSDEGSFKASEARYTEVSQISLDDLRRWLNKSMKIQWDYKNIVKHRGKLERIM